MREREREREREIERKRERKRGSVCAFKSSRKISLKISDQKQKNVRKMGGGQKRAKKCHVLFERPLSQGSLKFSCAKQCRYLITNYVQK